MSNRAYIANNLASLHNRINAAARGAGRNPEDITVVAVSRAQSQGAIGAAINYGQINFGETRLAEAMMKFPPLLQQHPNARLHLLGRVPRKNAQDAFRLCHMIETIDRPILSELMAKNAESFGFCPNLLIQVNIGNEPAQTGVSTLGADAFIRATKTRFGDALQGLMCTAPAGKDPTPYYKRLSAMADAHGLPVKSMGTSADFETAIREGATLLRIGTAIFGPRQV
jgi:pyridoxal phosphate enzyme (YggS family)